MSETNRYYIFSLLALVITGYLLFTEVYERIEGTVVQYSEVGEKEKALLTPEEFSLRKRELQIEKQNLAIWAKKNSISTQQHQGGLFGYLNSNAKQANVLVRSITPQETRTSGSATIIPFSMTFSAKYHSAAKFINSIETGSIPIVLTVTNIQAEKIGNAILTVTVTGQARLLAELR